MTELPRWALEVAFAGYVLIVSVFVVLERRKPTATLALLLALVFVPVIGLGTYLLFSRRRVRRQRAKRSRRAVLPVEQTAAIATVDALPEGMPSSQRRLVKLAMSTAAAPLRRAEGVVLLDTAPVAFGAFQTAIEAAQRCIHCEFYIWKDDETARAITAMLTERARAGVVVRVLVDHLGSIALPSSHFDALRAAGGNVRWYSPLRLPALRRRINFRNHRKIMTIDGNVGFLGGLNIGDEYLGASDKWRDLHVELTGDAVVGLDAIFLEDWLQTTGEVIDLRGTHHECDDGFDPRKPVPTRPARAARFRQRAERMNPFAGAQPRELASRGPLVQIIPSGPDTAVVGVIGTQLTAAIASASRRAWVATPYFIPDEPLMLALRTAALSGVDVRLLLPRPENNDQFLVAWAARSYYDDVLEAGGRIFEYNRGMLHAKYMVVDDVVCAIGSANMDVRSFHLNHEVTAMFYASAVARGLAEIFAHDVADSTEVTLKGREDPSIQTRLLENAARVLSPLL